MMFWKDWHLERGGRLAASLVSVGVLSFGALQTISRSLRAHRESGLIDCVDEFFVHFNAMTPDDMRVAEEAGVSYTGTAANLGIYGGFRAIAERAKTPYVLILENDVVPLPGARVRECLEACVSDMIEHGIKSFCLRSRREPGEGALYVKYIKTFGLIQPIAPSLAPKKAPPFSQLRMFLEHGSIDKFRAASLFCERDPETVQKPCHSQASERQLFDGFPLSELEQSGRACRAAVFFRRGLPPC